MKIMSTRPQASRENINQSFSKLQEFYRVNPFQVGDRIPNFTLKNIRGKRIKIQTHLAKGSVILIFARGQWYPYDSLELWTLQKSFLKNLSKHHQIILISPQPSEAFIETLKKQLFRIEILIDDELKVARMFGLMREISAALGSSYERFGVQIIRSKTPNKFEVMVPAIYKVNSEQKIIYARTESENDIQLKFQNALVVQDENYWLELI
ncbi:redoxin domain-containing protein [Capilliphycus salinus ALCB114379]|uniref:redoxin domain-containing protein n=1 Tax=Capilliphycus salinus TaxID=2768948 RepID=UPI0039A59622